MKTKWFCTALCLGMALPLVASAQNEAPESWALSESQIIGGNSYESGARLMDPITIDFDGDGIDDLVFGAPGTDPNGLTSAGSVYVLLGKKGSNLKGKRDLSTWDSFDYRFDGNTAKALLGLNIERGDFNGDGINDLAIAQAGSSSALYIIYGGKKLEKGIYSIRDPKVTDVVFYLPDTGSHLGISICVGDFNRDGIDDFAVSYLIDSNQGIRYTNVAIVTMRRQWATRQNDLNSKIYGKILLSRPIASNASALYTCTVGDFNDDGLLDLALGMPLDSYDNQRASGSLTIVYNPHKYIGTTLDLADINPKWGIRIFGDQANAQLGYALAGGDFTGDGRDDLAVSAPNRLVSGSTAQGVVYIYESGKLPKTSGLQEKPMQIVGKGGQFGFRLRNDDVNHDNRPDLIISSPFANSSGGIESGRLMVYYGGPHFVDALEKELRPDIDMSGTDFMNFGLGVTFGDFDGDEKIDAAVRLGLDPMQRPMTGAYAVISDIANLPSPSVIPAEFLTLLAPSKGGGIAAKMERVNIDAKSYRAWLSPGGLGDRSVICLEDEEEQEQNRRLSVADDCDINIIGPQNTRISDFTFSGSNSNSPPRLSLNLVDFEYKDSSGMVATVTLPDKIGKSLVLNFTPETLASQSESYYLANKRQWLGSKIEWTDLDGDGVKDLIIAAPGYSSEMNQSGAIFIVKGTRIPRKGIFDLATDNAVLTYEGPDGSSFGSEFHVIDFNLDGHLDLAVLAPMLTNSAGERLANIFMLYSVGLRPSKIYSAHAPEIGALRIVTPKHRAGLQIISQRVDLNRDGFDDLVLLTPDSKLGLQRQGAIYALFADEKMAAGVLTLDKDSLVNFSLTPNRNERFVDLRFIRRHGKLELLLLRDSVLQSPSYVLERYIDVDESIFSGHSPLSQLKKIGPSLKLNAPGLLILDADPKLQNDSIWVVEPHTGETRSGQGKARLLRWDENSISPKP